MAERNTYLKRILIFAAAGILLFAPFGLNLRPSDAGVFRGGFALAAGIVILAGLIYNGVKLSKIKPVPVLTDNKKEELRIQNLLRDSKSRAVVGKTAEKALDQLESTSRKAESFRQIVGGKFGETSLTYGRYAGVLDQGVETIVTNTSLLAARMQAFDEKQYLKLSKDVSSGTYRKDAVDDSLQEDQLVRMQKSLADMNAILDSNEHLLNMMTTCVNEVAALGEKDNTQANEDIIEEIQHLIETTKYYQ